MARTQLYFRATLQFDSSSGQLPSVCDSGQMDTVSDSHFINWTRLCEFGPLEPDQLLPVNMSLQLLSKTLSFFADDDVLFAHSIALPKMSSIANASYDQTLFGSPAGFSPLQTWVAVNGTPKFEWQTQLFCVGQDCFQADESIPLLALIVAALVVGVVGGLLSIGCAIYVRCRSPPSAGLSDAQMDWHSILEEIVTFSVEFSTILLLGLTDAELDLKIAFWIVTLCVATVMPHVACCVGPSLEHGGVLALGLATSVIAIVHYQRATSEGAFFSATRGRLLGTIAGFTVGLGITCLLFAIVWFPFVFSAWRAQRRANREAGIEEKSAFDGLRQTICCTWLFNCRYAAVDAEEFQRESTETTRRFVGSYSMFWLVSLFGLEFVQADTFTSSTTFALILLAIAAIFTIFVIRTHGQLTINMVMLYLFLAVLTNLFVICSLLSDLAIVRSGRDLGAVTGTLAAIVVVGSIFICCSCLYLIAFRIRIRRQSTKKTSPKGDSKRATDSDKDKSGSSKNSSETGETTQQVESTDKNAIESLSKVA